MRWPVLAALLAALPLAGCATDPGPAPGHQAAPEGLPVALANDTFFAFRHQEGALRFSLEGNGSASLVLYDGTDRRVAAIEVGSGEDQAAALALPLPAGDPVIYVEHVEGDLRVESGGRRVEAFRPLTSTMERVVLVSRPQDPAMGLMPDGDSINEVVPVAFQRAPASLRLVASDHFTDLHVDISSAAGPVLVALASNGFQPVGQGPNFYPTSNPQFFEIEAEVYAENFNDGAFEAHVQAADLSGALVAEGEVYSRAEIARTVHASIADDEPEFWWAGDLITVRPGKFEVASGTKWLYLRQPTLEDGQAPDATPGPATVALFDPQDKRVATVAVPYNVTLRVPVERAGTYVFWVLHGPVRLGADRSPPDLTTYPMDTASVVVPPRPAGTSSRYGQERAAVDVRGVPFQVTAVVTNSGSGVPFGPGFGCDQSGIVRLEQEGEGLYVVGAVMPGVESDSLGAAMRLRPGTLEVAWDGFGDDGCVRPAVRVTGYVRGGASIMD